MNHPNLKALLVSAFVSLTSITASNAADFPKGSPSFHTSHAAALKASKESGKPIIMIFSASWCGPCQANKNRVYPSKEVQPFHDKFVWAYLDADDAANVPAMEKAGVSGIPHMEILDKDQKRIAQSVGMTTPEDFSKTLATALKHES
jgi:thiol:disulfide interchange protein